MVPTMRYEAHLVRDCGFDDALEHLLQCGYQGSTTIAITKIQPEEVSAELILHCPESLTVENGVRFDTTTAINNGRTTVTWSMTGIDARTKYSSKVMALFGLTMDKVAGPD